MLKQISLFNVLAGLLFITVPAIAAETTSVSQSQRVVTESGKPPVVEQKTVTNSTVTTPNSTTNITPAQLLKTLMNSTVQPAVNTMQIPSTVIITLPPAQ